jgi:hypothetical protein
MEALTAVSIALLAAYDMLKAIDRSMSIEGIGVVSKAGGRSGSWSRDPAADIHQAGRVKREPRDEQGTPFVRRRRRE